VYNYKYSVIFKIKLKLVFPPNFQFVFDDVFSFLTWCRFFPAINPLPELGGDARIVGIDFEEFEESRFGEVVDPDVQVEGAESVELVLSQLGGMG
jgi:hypothetical protein